MNTQTVSQSSKGTQSSKIKEPKTFRYNHGFEAVGTILKRMEKSLREHGDMLADDGDPTP